MRDPHVGVCAIYDFLEDFLHRQSGGLFADHVGVRVRFVEVFYTDKHVIDAHEFYQCVGTWVFDNDHWVFGSLCPVPIDNLRLGLHVCVWCMLIGITYIHSSSIHSANTPAMRRSWMRRARILFGEVRRSMSGVLVSGSVPCSRIHFSIADFSYEIPFAHKMVGFTMVCLEIGQAMAAWTALRGDCILDCFDFGAESSDCKWSNLGRLYFVQFFYCRFLCR